MKRKAEMTSTENTAEGKTVDFLICGLLLIFGVAVVLAVGFVTAKADERYMEAAVEHGISVDAEGVELMKLSHDRLMLWQGQRQRSVSGLRERIDTPLIESSSGYGASATLFTAGDAEGAAFGDPVSEVVIDFGGDRWRFDTSKADGSAVRVLIEDIEFRY